VPADDDKAATPPPDFDRAAKQAAESWNAQVGALAEQLADGIGLITSPEHAFEIRCILRGGGAVHRFFQPDEVQEAARFAAVSELIGNCQSIGVSLNPIPSHLAVDLQAKRRALEDGHVCKRRRFVVDIDPVKPAGCESATDAEKERAYRKALAVSEYLRGDGWPDPLLLDTGIGYHLLYSVDLPNTGAVKELFRWA
jgi:hypothetical protein